MVHQFTLEIKGLPDMDAAFVELPLDMKATFGTLGQVKIKATFDGEPYRGSLMNMGLGNHCLHLLKEIRQKIGKQAGDLVEVTVEQDFDERIVEVPDDLAELLAANPQAEAFFQKLSFTNRKEYAVWISGAKRPETRTNRLALTIEKLLAGKRNPSEK